MSLADVLQLLGGVALFLFGMSLMGEGLRRVAGTKLEVFLYRLTGTPLKGILLGTGVTAVIQSSSATSVMVVGFVNSGMMKVRQAISIILGAILGTSITGWVLCLSDIGGGDWTSLLSTATITSIVAIVGIILRMFTKKQQNKNIGDILLGFGVLMFGMQMMSASVAGLRDSEAFTQIISTLSNPILGILVGAAFTCIIQSASAAVGIVQALSVTGAVDFSVALPLIMGIAIGAAVPVLISALGADTNGKRTAFVYLLIDVLGVLIWAIIFYALNAIFAFSFMHAQMTMVSVALLNTLFRLLTVLSLAPLIGLLERIVALIYPEKEEDRAVRADMDRLEERFLVHPALAVEQSRITTHAMAKKAQRNLETAFGLLAYYTEETYQKVQSTEAMIDRYEDKIGSYLMKLTEKELDPQLSREVTKFLHTVGDFERLSDHAANIAETAKEIHEKNLVLSPYAMYELEVLTNAVVEVLDLAISAFIQNDLNLAYRVEPLEDLIDNLCDELKLNHVSRLRKGECTLDHGFVFNDLLTNYERVADHCSNIGVAVIELESDTFDTHEYLQSVKDLRSEKFEAYKKEYSLRFKL